ncbi:CrcB family protein [Actinocorallia aurea]
MSGAEKAVASQWPVLAVVGVGGALGASARFGISEAFPRDVSGFGWATFWINVSGCFLIGVLMVAVTEVWRVHRLVRPFLGVGVLGGFTTFSTAMVEVQAMAAEGAPAGALGYLAGTLAAAFVAVRAGVGLARTAWTGRGRR